MKVFISWSGERSRKLAESLRDWLPGVVHAVKPFFTPNDIEKGVRWSTGIEGELKASSFGIFCMTRTNLSAPWLLYEAGALSTKADARVCPVLFDVDSGSLTGPLQQFQLTTKFEEMEMRKLVRSMNAATGERRVDDTVLDKGFDKWWPDLQAAVSKILAEAGDGEPPKRSDSDVLAEVLQLVRLNAAATIGTPDGLDRTMDVGLLKALARGLVTTCETVQAAGTPLPPALKDMYDALVELVVRMPPTIVGARFTQPFERLDKMLCTSYLERAYSKGLPRP